MAVKSERLEFRVAPDDRSRIERAAAVAGVSVSSFIVETAVERADSIIAANTITSVPATYFDDLLAALDRPEAAPGLSGAARRARRTPRITRT